MATRKEKKSMGSQISQWLLLLTHAIHLLY